MRQGLSLTLKTEIGTGMLNRVTKIRVNKFFVFLPLFFPFAGNAAEAAALEEVLQGFDEPPAAQGSAIDSVLEGFDDAAPQPDAELDEILEGFDSTPGQNDTAPGITDEGHWQLGGDISLSTAYNYAHKAPAAGQTDYRGLSRLRTRFALELDGRLAESWQAHAEGHAFYDAAYSLNGRSDYNDELLEDYEKEAELGEAWLRGGISRSLDVKLGRQIVVWGKSDNLRVTDVLNPMDMREPGMVDIEDLRLPLTMARADYYAGDWGFTALAIPEIRFNKLPAYGSEFYPYPTPQPKEQVPADGNGNTEYALAANGIFTGWDLSLYWADIYDDTPHSVAAPAGPVLAHSRLKMIGAAVNVAVGNWLLKSEAARFDGIEYSGLPAIKKRRTDLLLGAEYSGFHDTTLSAEVVRRHTHGFTNAMKAAGVTEDDYQSALRYTGNFLHDRLELTALAILYGANLDEGGFGRFSAKYDIRDALTLSGGVVIYHEGEQAPLLGIEDSDRLFAEIKYSF